MLSIAARPQITIGFCISYQGSPRYAKLLLTLPSHPLDTVMGAGSSALYQLSGFEQRSKSKQT
ncbi:hypothetical protein E2C01_050206 [Portunus trituberculatus]|uniref:Uncharacterized protein n=1 Tax=Portunus trituberculatus TaxID=210409 RepID=A0A5B7GFW9_PORTR|nr:hypothetical protein [Portunus trituberculatus]